MKSILVGNGINIAFSKNDDYKNYEVINRLARYLLTDRYDDVFGKAISSSELRQILEQLNLFFNDMLSNIASIRLTGTADELNTLVDISRRYHMKSKDLVSVGIEDYFFVMKMVFNRLGDDKTPIHSLYDGLKYLFLDSLYNDGAIQQLYKQMACFEKELSNYDEIFTVNYDNNLDQITSKTVHHLHGSFLVLDDTYKSDTVIGYLAQQKPKPPTVIKGKEHLYCNAVMAFSGARKLEIIETYSNSNAALDTIVSRLNNPNDHEAHEYIARIKTSSDPNHIISWKSIEARLNNPSLRNTEYPIDLFKSISGEIHILGLSPNNDSHLIQIINDNPNIKKIIYFSASDDDSTAARRVFKKELAIENVFDYWGKLGI